MPTSISFIAPDSSTALDQAASTLGPGPWLVIAPHDDDAILGMGLAIRAATLAGMEVHIAVVTDGRMGWNDPAERDTLVAVRAAELQAACRVIGVPDERLHHLGFPDGSLHLHQGCRPDADGGGLGRALTRVFRTVRPGAIFCATAADLHPDHRYTASETAMAAAWASGPIWQELGKPITAPRMWHYAVYCEFPQAPDCQIVGAPAHLSAKLSALACFVSQPFIDAMVAAVRANGAVEYLREVTVLPYRPSAYAALFSPACNSPVGNSPVGNSPVGQSITGKDTILRDDADMVLAGLDAWQAWPALNAAIAHPLRLVGEGSSRLFVAGFARHLAHRFGVPLTLDAIGGRAADAARRNVAELIVSNSGATRELIEHVDAQSAPLRLALLGLGNGPLVQRIAERRVVLPHPERAVAATASVFLQAFTLGAAIAAQAGAPIPVAALHAAVAEILSADVPEVLTAALSSIRRIWWSDSESGVADELALKTAELCGLPGIAAPGTLALHGLEEIFSPGDCVIWLCPDQRDAPLRAKIAQSTATLHIDLTQAWPLPVDVGPWNELLLLVQGWRVLGDCAVRLGRDPAKPNRARKVGNPLP